MALTVKLVHPDAKPPSRASKLAAGYDLTSVEEHHVRPGARAVVSTGLVVGLPEGTYGRIAPRSGLAVQHGITVLAGVVDRDYTGVLKVVLHNCGRDTFDIYPRTRIAQLILERHECPEVEVVDTIAETERGVGGFGSTGV